MNEIKKQVTVKWQRMLPSVVLGLDEWWPCTTWDSYHHNYQEAADGKTCEGIGSNERHRLMPTNQYGWVEMNAEEEHEYLEAMLVTNTAYAAFVEELDKEDAENLEDEDAWWENLPGGPGDKPDDAYF